jgi:hypothetical protein
LKINHLFCFIINYKPLLDYKKEIKNFNKIYCKNFFLFFLLLNYIKQKQIHNTRLSIYKKNYFSQSFLRAPNKYKKAQIKINLTRYKIVFSMTINYTLNDSLFLNINNLIYFLNYSLSYFLFFESSFFFLEKKKLVLILNNKLQNKFFFEL